METPVTKLDASRQPPSKPGAKAPPLFYVSYARYSTKGQRLGQSEARQIERAEEYAAKHGLKMLKSIVDQGVSAFRGANARKGAGLGDFVDDARTGRIPPGTRLLIEDFSRLSRQETKETVALLWDILRAKGPDGKMLMLAVVTLVDEQVYVWDETFDQFTLFKSLMKMEVAHEHSRKISEYTSRSIAMRKKAGTFHPPTPPGPETTAHCRRIAAVRVEKWAEKRAEHAERIEPLVEAVIKSVPGWWGEWARELNRQGIPMTRAGALWPCGKFLMRYCAKRPKLRDYGKRVALKPCKPLNPRRKVEAKADDEPAAG